ncbi:MAG TPA: hypothetical protein PLE45_05720 [Spirochaetota bacterium]|nr:hypothetical protein [Spirochaetota bacterium]HOM39222.1 hypothetical protein [Spirochaetota bacterium]HPP04219.1 hypothetical protein [Spirochaetota bacterium]
MEIDNIKNKLIILKNERGLKKELVEEIQNTLLTKVKKDDFENLLKKVELEIKNSQSNKK